MQLLSPPSNQHRKMFDNEFGLHNLLYYMLILFQETEKDFDMDHILIYVQHTRNPCSHHFVGVLLSKIEILFDMQ